MDLKEALYTRRCVREFTTEPIDDAALRQLIDAAVQAPSAINQQPWLFCVIRDKTMLAEISQQAKMYVLKSSPFGPLPHHLQQLLNDQSFDIFYHAPALVVISATAGSPFVTEDCAVAAENLMLAARAAGLGTCWIGLAEPWLETPDGKTLLKLPPNYKPVAPIIVGHPKSEPPPVPRKDPEIRWLDPS
jgi:nitroreductase